MDSFLVTIVVVLIAALGNWLQQRALSRHELPPDPSPDKPPRPAPPRLPMPKPPRPVARPTGPPPTLETSLERELRRLLGADEPEPPPPAPQAPPMPPRPSITPPAPASHAAPVALAPAPLPAHLAHLTESVTSYSRAQKLHGSVAERLREATEQTEKHGRPVSGLHPLTSTPRTILAGLRANPGAARQAFVASLVFGAPRGFEEL